MQITFDTSKDTLANILAVTHAAFGVAVAAFAAGPALGAGNTAEQTHSDDTNKTDGAGQNVDVTTRDKDGLPWDVRVHSTPATMTEKGVWRAKRGRQETDYNAVKAEYQGGVQQTQQTTQMSAPGGMQKPPAMSAPPVQKTAYQKLFDYLAEMGKQGRAPADWVQESLSGYNVEDGNILNLQNADPKFVEQLHDEFVKVLGE